MRKRYAICGVSNRSMKMFIGPMLKTFSNQADIVGLLDSDPRRFEVCKIKYPELAAVPEYNPSEFALMVERTKPDVIIVVGRDDTHAGYIIQALEHDLDVLSEKPMATTGDDCRKIMEAEARSKGTVTVTFNYRYAPIHSRIKEMVLEGKVGRVTSVDLNWYIDTYHGASYFKRWNRIREHSGGLSIHKSSHHFDLVNWWIGQKPKEVFAYGARNYYGTDGAMNPKKEDGRYCATCDVKQDCNYFMRWSSRSKEVHVKDDHIGTEGPADANAKAPYSLYRADSCIFDSEINIEDTYSTNVKYDGGALLSYSVNFSLPYEGYRLAINGTKGRIETMEYHSSGRVPFPVPEQTIDYFPLFGSKETIHVVHREGGHGGGDPALLEDIFLGSDPKRAYPILSGSMDGAYSVAAGEAVWRSVQENRPIRIEDVLGMNPHELLNNKTGG
ncbi:Gfo/Idh/MocA family protein [Paenibacillus radicis (ex Xue et al. 2023)]|uniref:Gfo/Idh/MocA family oxidoreductase n=1 Tax=Paenibacillus radicis (ex Xue et al. 2023) TaxID=2972489 RepID=A0ABT1YN87_9BACL|nr:Gfo/Idh/MocA family oxidoreductase [Paenibacillus radicis (ex Xue et al. 2023)]MCR8634639.1 Gfo/Idh/MocA family oxidoreductase [Paenibacillus radicis (ex Xue et al. 2023)]